MGMQVDAGIGIRQEVGMGQEVDEQEVGAGQEVFCRWGQTGSGVDKKWGAGLEVEKGQEVNMQVGAA